MHELGVAGPSGARQAALQAAQGEHESPPTIPKKRSSDVENRRSCNPERFQFWYISECPTPRASSLQLMINLDAVGERVEAMCTATIRLDPEDFVNLRKIEFRFDQRNHPFAQQLKLVDAESRLRDDTGCPTFFGYMVEDGAPPRCSKFDESAQQAAAVAEPIERAKKRRKTPEIENMSDDDFVAHPDVLAGTSGLGSSRRGCASPPQPHRDTFARTHSAPAVATADPSRSLSRLAADAALHRVGRVSPPGPAASASLSAIPGPSKPRQAPRLSSHIPIHEPLADPDTLTTSVNLPDFDVSAATIFPAGSYEIILIVDTREVESKSSRDKITETLLAKGVKVETRALRLGDMCWIARRLDGYGGEEDECVLDYVVERKRLDDLCSSIKDGRYTEQCVSSSDPCSLSNVSGS